MGDIIKPMLETGDRTSIETSRPQPFAAALPLAVLFFAFALNGQPASVDQANIPCNLVSWWPLDGDATDIRGGNTGTVTGNGTYPAAKVASGWKGTGPGSLIVVPNSSTLDISKSTRGFTVDLWLKIDRINDPNMVIVWKGYKGTDVTSPFYIAIQGTNSSVNPPGTVYFSVADGTRSQYIKSPAPLQVGTFVHVTASADGINLVLYINGQQVVRAPQTVKPYASSHPLQIGGSSASPSNFFNGVIDELELFDRALDPTPRSEIAAIYEAGSRGKCGKKEP